MIDTILPILSRKVNIPERLVKATVKLLTDGATIPFIARYRKEATGGLDEVAIGAIDTTYQKLCELQARKETILSSIAEQDKLTDALKSRIESTWESSELEDIYLPFKPKRQTKAELARKRGLEPLAQLLMFQNENDPEGKALRFINDEVPSAESALKGAMDIVAEWISEDEFARNRVRRVYDRTSEIKSKVVKGKEEEGEKYREYFDHKESLLRCPSHRFLALRRAEQEGIVKLAVAADNDEALEALERKYVKGRNRCSQLVKEAMEDSYKRLLKSSIENETLAKCKEKADEEAIKVFADNLRQLLLEAPLGQVRTLAIDPGFRTGCKIVCLNEQGDLIHNEAIYPHAPQKEWSKSISKLSNLIDSYAIEAVAIGNGTASFETQELIDAVKQYKKVSSFVVNESGASIYSASKVAREEFPQYDVTVRGAVSIGRRLMDPLAELVKIDPKSIGVGQYQHDVDQSKLKASLDRTVEYCVNLVGVNLNTASKHLLTYISGLGPTLAQNIVDYRAENGAFKTRKELLKVARLGQKAFEQCAGFLRIQNGTNPLDASAVHPESYYIVEQMAKDLGCSVSQLMSDEALRKQIDPARYLSDTVGLPTIQDILKELDKPGRDPRDRKKAFSFSKEIRTMNDLKEGMVVNGIVNNITNFGCFVNIGIKENGLIHKSHMAKQFVNDPSQYVSLNQEVRAKVVSIDKERKRIGLSLIDVE